MIDTAGALAAIDRVGRIEWRPDPARLGSHAALMREYLRRSAVCAEALGRTADWPWYDATAQITLLGVDPRSLPGYVFLDPEPEYRGPGTDLLEDKVIALNSQMNGQMNTSGHVQDGYARKVCFWFIRWASVQSHPVLAALDLPDLYEPLIVFYERGGWFRPEQGYLDLDGANVTMAGWRNAAQQPPLPSLDPQTLDRLDEADRTRRERQRKTP